MFDPQPMPVRLIDAHLSERHFALRALGATAVALCAPVVEADRYSEGFAAGAAEARAAAASEIAAMRTLLATAQVFQPEASDAWQSAIARTVERLVAEIVGTAQIDAGWLADKIAEALAAIETDEGERTLWLHPDDLALLDDCDFGVTICADPAAARGAIRISHATGSIEHGTTPALDALRAQLAGS